MGSVTSETMLHANDVHVWKIALTTTSARVFELRNLLHEEELARADRFKLIQLTERFITGRAALRLILASYVGTQPQNVRFTYGKYGKPDLVQGADTTPLYFNLTHSGDLALLAVTQARQVGIDVETVRPVDSLNHLARMICSPSEYDTLIRLPSGDQLTGFFNCWTRKEAYIKATGKGLSQPLDQVTVTLSPGAKPELLYANDADEANRWRIENVTVDPPYLAAITVERLLADGEDHPTFAYFTWNSANEQPSSNG